MRRKGMIGTLIAFGLLAVSFYAGRVLATPSSGFSGSTLAVGRFDEIDVFHNVTTPQGGAHGSATNSQSAAEVWVSMQKTKGTSDLYVQNNVWQPGGTTGWHTHPGHSLIIVTAGTVSVYDGDDPTCTAKLYSQGMGFLDEGGSHVHNIRNEGAVEARTMAVQLIPAGATRRVDAPAPGNCAF